MSKARLIAFYLPQFHPTPENDKWWGKGFTEWTSVSKMRPLFPGHSQPNLPGELGFYDLRVPETRQAQADMARQYGVEGFCYWHYWFSGRRLLERPFAEVLKSGEPDFPFCLAWANETWRGFHGPGNTRNVLLEQRYDGVSDYTAHFNTVLPALRDPRYITVDGCPLFMIYKPLASPEIITFIDTWRRLAAENGLPGIYFVGHVNENGISADEVLATGVDAVNTVRLGNYYSYRTLMMRARGRINEIFRKINCSFPYRIISRYFIENQEDSRENVYPSIIPSWDHSPRTGRRAFVVTGSTPELFGKHIDHALAVVKDKKPEHKLIFIKSWNEWAEGNYIEPDSRWGRAYLEVLGQKIQ